MSNCPQDQELDVKGYLYSILRVLGRLLFIGITFGIVYLIWLWSMLALVIILCSVMFIALTLALADIDYRQRHRSE